VTRDIPDNTTEDATDIKTWQMAADVIYFGIEDVTGSATDDATWDVITEFLKEL
jgi:hypothetical protein